MKSNMVKPNKLLLATAIASACALAACDVDQTQDGEMPEVDADVESGNLPEYEVVQTEEGDMPDLDVDVESGQMPEFDVDWMDVDVGMREKTVTVPKVEVVMEEEQVSVPFIDVRMPDDADSERMERTLELSARFPHPGYEVNIVSVYAVEGRIIVIGQASETDSVEANEARAVRISDRVVLNAPDADVRYYLMGERPLNVGDGNFRFVSSTDEIQFDLNRGRELYAR